MTGEGFDRAIARLAAAQHGVISRDQAARLGATKGLIQNRLRAGRWDRLAPHVFRLAGSASSWRQSLMAACLAWGPDAVVSHRAAAALWRLAGFGPGPVELTLPRRRRVDAPGVVHHSVLLPAEVTTVEGFPVTNPTRTLLDVATVAPRDIVEEATDDALRRRIVSMPRLRWHLGRAEWEGRRGVKVMRALVDARGGSPVPQSVLETRLLRLLREAGLPEPASQHPVRSSGRLVAVVDFAWPDLRLAIEADGYRWHSGRIRWEHDRARGNELTLLGWRIVHVTWTDLSRRPEAVLAAVRRSLAANRIETSPIPEAATPSRGPRRPRG
ncbi:MAG: DUF559 domain-containing protein [Acidobacteria bacterium]|nr:DUF559 domain-containing protein [Acidobacteriota bacterium]